MAFAATKSKKLTTAAASLCSAIFSEPTNKPITCPMTGLTFEPVVDWDELTKVDENAVGVMYVALGYRYVYCFGYEDNNVYVSIYKDTTTDSMLDSSKAAIKFTKSA